MRCNPWLVLALVLGFASPVRAQCELDDLHSSNGQPGDRFGYRIGLSGDTAVVAAPNHDGERGAVYVFERSGGAWSEVQALVASDGDAGDNFGYDLDLEGDTLVVGAINDEDPNGPDSGSAYVFVRQGGVWVEVQKLAPSTGTGADQFGSGMALDGDVLMIGASSSDLYAYEGGAVFVFERSGGSFVESDILFAQGYGDLHRLGWKIALQGPRALVSSEFIDQSEVVHVFEESAGTWSQTATLTHAGPPHASWGTELALDGGTALVCTSVDTGDPNRELHHFELQGGAWTLVDTIVPPPGTRAFGWSLVLRGGDLWVGAPFDDETGMSSGAVLRFVRSGNGPFAFAGKWVSRAPSLHADFGYELAIEGTTALFGEPRLFSNQSGLVRVFELPEPATYAYCFCEHGPCGNVDADSGCANSTGPGGRLHVCASASVALDEVRLTASHLRPGQFALAFMGGGQASNPLGDGLRCTNGGGVGQFRFPVQLIDAEGNLKLGPGLVALSHASFPPSGRIQPGQTWNFQFWYRDPPGPCGSHFNLTNAVRIAFH